MKKFLAMILIPFLAALVACSNSAATRTSTEAATLSEEGELLVGTLKLENTDLAVTTEQASELLPLWETLQSLDSSGTAAALEVQAVTDQIKSTMTSEQIAGITAMNLTNADLQAAISANGTATTASTSSNTSDLDQIQMEPGTVMGGPNDGGAGGGTPPTDLGGGSGMTGSIDMTAGAVPQTSSTQSAKNSASNSANQIPTTLINALVRLLQTKVG
jgi:hypothetical protein